MGTGLNRWGKVGGQLLAIGRQFFAARLHWFNTAQLKSFVLRLATCDLRLATISARLATYPTFLLPLSSFLLLLLSSCGPDEPEIKYTLTSVLPSPVTPGETVVLYGTLPKDATVKLVGGLEGLDASGNSGVNLPGVSMGKSLQVTLPETIVAGDRKLEVETPSGKLVGSVQVLPKVSGVEQVGSLLKVRGLGWPDSGAGLKEAKVQLEVQGQMLEPSLEQRVLTATLPSGMAYGGVAIKVWVQQQASEAFTFVREAGAVKGVVVLPAGGSGYPGGVQQQRSLNRNEAALPLANKVLLVVHKPRALEGLDLSGLTHRQSLNSGALGLSRLVFNSVYAAQSAIPLLKGLYGVQKVHYEQGMRIEGSEAVGLERKPSSICFPSSPLPPFPSSPLPSAPLPLCPSASSLTAQSPNISTQQLTPATQQWYLNLTSVPGRWGSLTGSGITVAVVDTGVALSHPDLVGNLLPGWDFVDGDGVPEDTVGHGTHVAGTVGAKGLVVGVAPGVKIVPVRVLGGASGGSEFTVAQGILWAANLLDGKVNGNPAQVINLSLGTDTYSEVLASAVGKVLEKGVVVVAAAGNSGGSLAYPAAFPGVIAVSALAGPKTAYQPWYSNRGPGLWVAAFGGDTTQDQDGDGQVDGIYATDRMNDGSSGYGYRMGTSMASPQVAGLAALALSSGFSPMRVKEALAGTANDIGPLGYDLRFGYGLATAKVLGMQNPRLYVLALGSDEKVLGWSLVQPDLFFGLSNLVPGREVSLLVAGDSDGDGELGELAELVSQPVKVLPQGGKVLDLPVVGLSFSSGSKTWRLP